MFVYQQGVFMYLRECPPISTQNKKQKSKNLSCEKEVEESKKSNTKKKKIPDDD